MSPYLIREELHDNDESVKQPVRDQVGEFLLKHNNPDRMRLMGLPGVSWKFENQIAYCWPKQKPLEFVGYERVSRLVTQSLKFMPRRFSGVITHDIETRRGPINYVQTDQAVLFNMDVKDALRTTRAGFCCSSQQNRWVRMAKGCTAGWLDFTCQMHDSLETSLMHVGNFIDRYTPTAPFAMTYLRGREDTRWSDKHRSLDISREEYIARVLGAGRFRRFELLDSIAYSSCGVGMGVVMGLFHLK